MIRVTAEPGRLTLEGHAGYAPAGQDIVCAAVSALMLALAERMQEKNLVRELIMRPGYMRIAMRGAEKETELVKCGLKQLQRRFPRYVEVKEAGGVISLDEGVMIRVVAYHGKGESHGYGREGDTGL